MATRHAWSRRLGGLFASALLLALGATPAAAQIGPASGAPSSQRIGSAPSSSANQQQNGTIADAPAAPSVSLEFRAFYDRSGGVPIFGYPLSGSVLEGGQRVQYFERQRFELHPENAGTPYEVELGRLGRDDAQRQGLLDTPPFQPVSPGGSDCEYFSQTKHRVCDGFRAYWQSHGLDFGDPGTSYRESLALFGYPISEEFQQHGVTVQYFERARFEWHPENPAPNDIELGLLGHDAWAKVAATAVAAPPLPTLGPEIAQEAQNLVGSPYVWGGTTPAGFDCSGFVYYVVNQVTGGGFPRDMGSQASSGVPVDPNDLQPGDLVFQQNTYQAGLSHAGIYIGDGKFVSAENPSTGVAVGNLWDGYWGPRFYAARRIQP